MKIQVLGTGCPSCKQLMQNVMTALAEADVAADVEKVEDIQEIAKAGVMRTPALVIDGQVKVVGRVPNVADLKKLVNEAKS